MGVGTDELRAAAVCLNDNRLLILDCASAQRLARLPNGNAARTVDWTVAR